MRRLVGAGGWAHVDPSSRWLGFHGQGGRDVLLRSLADWEAPVQRVGEHAGPISAVRFHPDGRTLAAVDRAGEVRLWPIEPSTGEPLWIHSGAPEDSTLVFDATGQKLGVFGVVAAGKSAHEITEKLRFVSLEQRADR